MLRPLSKSVPLNSRPCHQLASRYLSSFAQPGRQLSHQVKPLALTTFTQKTALVRRYASNSPPTPHPMAAPGTYQRLDKEAHFRNKKWEVDPEGVTSTSSTISVFGGPSKPSPADEEDVDMLAGIKSDIVSIFEPSSSQAFSSRGFRTNSGPRHAENIPRNIPPRRGPSTSYSTRAGWRSALSSHIDCHIRLCI